MRGFKTLWRLALGTCAKRPGPRDDEKLATTSGALPRKTKDKTALLLDAEPPTRTLQ